MRESGLIDHFSTCLEFKLIDIYMHFLYTNCTKNPLSNIFNIMAQKKATIGLTKILHDQTVSL